MKRASMLMLGMAAAVACFGLSAASTQAGVRVKSEPLRPSLQAQSETLRLQWQAAPGATSTAGLRLPPMPASRIEAMQQANQSARGAPLLVGVERDLRGEAASHSVATWEVVPGGWVAQMEVVSSGAAALRVAVVAAGLPEGSFLRYANLAGSEEVLGADLAQMREQVDELGRYWTATTSGDRQLLQWFVPATHTGAFVVPPPQVAGIAHLFVDPMQPDAPRKALGNALACNRDVACYVEELGPGFVAAKNAVAHYTFQGCTGLAVCMCTGTLLADHDPSTQHAWFYTAGHCIDSQARANTLETFWNYEAPTCGVIDAGLNHRVGGGADVVARADWEDAVLLKLRGNLPDGVHFAGWDSRPLVPGTPILAIHHPRGDARKVTFGTFTGHESNVAFGGYTYRSTATVHWTQGTLEGASSGSGAFTRDGEDYYFRGSAMEGTELGCQGGVAYYGPLELTAVTFQPFLGSAAAGATRDYTGQWYNANQARRGLSLFRLSGGGLFSLWFRYDSQNRPQWYQLEDIWTGPDRLGGRVARFTQNSGTPTFTGTYTLVFNSATTATFSYNNVDGDSGTVSLTKGTP